MILRRFHARRFLGLPDEAFEFAAGVNVVIGPNEAGKSSLRAAIHAVLYGNPATTSTKFRDEFRSWGAEEPPVLILEFEVDGKRFVLTKDFATRKVTLQDELGRTWDQHKIVQERVAAQLGLVTEDLFEATAQVAQAELERIHINSIAKELGRIVGGGGEDVTTAIRRLDQHVRAMEKGTKALTKDPGVLRATEDKVASLKEEQRRLSSSAAAADRIRVELTTIRETLATATDTLKNKRAVPHSCSPGPSWRSPLACRQAGSWREAVRSWRRWGGGRSAALPESGHARRSVAKSASGTWQCLSGPSKAHEWNWEPNWRSSGARR